MNKATRCGVGGVAMAWALSACAPGSDPPSHTSEEPPVPPLGPRVRKVALNAAPGEPIGLAVLGDGRVLHTTRTGAIWMHDPESGENRRLLQLDVYTHDEEGLEGIAVQPDFDTDGWVYVYYSPRLDTPTGDAPQLGQAEDWAPFRGVMRLSRFELADDAIDADSEQVVLEIPTDRGICCHIGGQIDFDAAGNLYLSTGDDTYPFNSDGFSPLDERDGLNPAFDAQRTAANTNDLRGKLLRIRVLPDGTYEIPDGNLFEASEETRPEIYLMGLRNPFRFAVDRARDRVFVADYSPDADAFDPARGPAGQGKWMAVDAPGNFGWPYCATAELPYVDYDFATGVSGEAFDCARPVNDSRHNTGLRELPPVVQPDFWYSFGPSTEHPELAEGGVGPMAGPMLEGEGPLSGGPLFYEWVRNSVFRIRLGDAGPVLEPVLTELTFDGLIDLEFGPDGSLYTLEYGHDYFLENPTAQLSRIEQR